MWWWTVVTDCGTRRTLAVSRAKAIRNVKYRLVMDDRSYSRPRPRDFAEMRDIEILEVRRAEPASLDGEEVRRTEPASLDGEEVRRTEPANQDGKTP